MRGRTWRNIDVEKASKIRDLLVSLGAERLETPQSFEVWRYRIKDCTITYYTSGTMYATPTQDPDVSRIIERIEKIIGFIYTPPTREWCVGVDETGKGEVFGYLHVVGVVFHKELFGKIEKVVGSVETKRRRSEEFWEQLYSDLENLMGDRFFFVEERISPADIDDFNLNELLDVTYMRVLKRIFDGRIPPEDSRIIIDDYGVSERFKEFTQSLEQRGAEVIIKTKSEEEYLESRLAAIIAKWKQIQVLKRIRENPAYRIRGVVIGSGNLNEDSTLKWIKRWYKSGKPWPWFVRKSYRTIYRLDESLNKPRKNKIFKESEN